MSSSKNPKPRTTAYQGEVATCNSNLKAGGLTDKLRFKELDFVACVHFLSFA
jgi:hypothetical protein